MSTFSGNFSEILGISVDSFLSHNLKSYAYFLSHCHTDHMYGLSSNVFQERLLNNEHISLYASHISVLILTKMYPNIKDKLKVLPMNSSSLVEIKSDDENEQNKMITVTLIPAGHCPGSVMFLFEHDVNVLYTGDIRLQAGDLAKMNALYTTGTGSRIKKRIDVLYLDTTFFSPKYPTFASRPACLRALIDHIREWISLSPRHNINLITSAKYGHEFLFMGIYREMKMPIHVNSDACDLFKVVPEMREAITNDGKATQIHASCVGYKIICRHENVRTIKTCAMRWMYHKDGDSLVSRDAYVWNSWFTCFSCHSSYNELLEIINFIKPSRIEPNVVPVDEQAKCDLYKHLEKALKVSQGEQVSPADTEQVLPVANKKLFELHIDSELSRNNESENVFDDTDLLGSPPSMYKRKRFNI